MVAGAVATSDVGLRSESSKGAPSTAHHLQPELGAFVLGDPQAEDFLLTGQVDAQRQVHRLHPHGAFTHLGVDAVEVDDGVDRIERP